MSESLSQLILKQARETAENTRVIRSLLEQHFETVTTEAKPRTELHDDLDQFVIEAADEPLNESSAVEQDSDTPEEDETQPTKAEIILARFRSRVGSQ